MMMTLSRSAKRLGLLLPLLLLGCSSAMPGRDTSEPVREYLLEWHAGEAAVKPKSDAPVLQITPTRAAAGFNSSDMIYVRQPHQLQRFAHHRWTDSPARMLDPLLVRAAETSGQFSAVAAPGTPIAARLRLDTQLLHLQQRIDNGGSHIELAVRFNLIDTHSSQQLATETQQLTVASETTPYGGVQASNQAVDRLMKALIVFLRQHAL